MFRIIYIFKFIV